MRYAVASLAWLATLLLPLGYIAAAPPEVIVSRPVEREFTEEEHFAGRAEASTTVEIRSRVSGYLEKVLFKEGSEVKKGDVLFQLDDRSYRAELEKAEAHVASSEARLNRAEADLARAKKLLEAKSISREELDKFASAMQKARAASPATCAGRELARLNLESTRITAPISGRIGKALLDAGNVVEADGSERSALAKVVVLDPISVYFDVSEATVLRLWRRLDEAARKKRTVSAYLHSANEEELIAEIDFADNRVDPATGLRARAVTRNPKSEVLPGMSVGVRVPLVPPRKALLIPKRAIVHREGKLHVLVVNDKNILERRPVKMGPLVGDLRVIEEGLGPKDVVVVDRAYAMEAGDEVKPTLEEAKSDARRAGPVQCSRTAWQAPPPDLPGDGPAIVVTAVYPGANARTVEETVAVPIEQQLNGLEGVTRRFLVCSDEGEMRLVISFKKGTDLDKSMVLAMNRVQVAEPALPEEVRRHGVKLKKRPVLLLAVSLLLLDDSRERESLGRIGEKLREELVRVPAVADVAFHTEPVLSQRLLVDVDPTKLAARGLTLAEVQSRLRDMSEAAGQDEEKLANAILIVAKNGTVIRVRDVARIDRLESFSTVTRLDGNPCMTLWVYQSADANARETTKAIRDRLKDLARTLPQGIEYRVIE